MQGMQEILPVFAERGTGSRMTHVGSSEAQKRQEGRGRQVGSQTLRGPQCVWWKVGPWKLFLQLLFPNHHGHGTHGKDVVLTLGNVSGFKHLGVEPQICKDSKLPK